MNKAPTQTLGWNEDEAKERCDAARKRKSDAERALISAAKELAAATEDFAEADKVLQRERKSAPLRLWTKANSIADRFQYVRAGYGLVREIASIDNKRPWRVQKGKGFLTDRLGRVLTYTTVEAAAVYANEIIDTTL